MKDSRYDLAQLIDLGRLQRTCEGLSAATGMTLAVLDPDGDILVASGWQDVCAQFHRANPATAACCLESDQRINQRLREGIAAPEHIAYKCANGLWDVAFPLVIGGRHVGTVFTGQFFYDDDEIDAEDFRRKARELGFDEPAYLDALMRVPVLTHEQVERTISFLADLVGTLGESGLNALRDREAEAQLQRSQEILRAVLDAIPARVFWKDTDLRYLGANKPFAQDAGFDTPQQVVGKDDYQMAWRDQADVYRADDLAVLEEGRPKLLFEEPQVRDGEQLTLLTSKVPLRDAGGDVIGVLGTYLDVTERAEAQRQAEEMRELLNYIIQHDQNAVAVMDRDLRYTYVSERFLDDYRIADRNVIGKTHYEIFPEIPQRWRDVHRRVLAGAVEGRDEDPFVRGDGTVDWVRWECRPWYHGDGSIGGMVLYSELITERREAAEALRRSEAEVRRLAEDLERRVELRAGQLAATNRELESFAYSISHDLRAPLRALNGFSEILLQDYDAVLDDAGRDYLRRIKGAANHMAGLMDGLLKLSRLNKDELVLEDADLTAVAAAAVAQLREQDPGRTVDVIIQDGLRAWADPKMLRLVIDNLLANAWKFTSRHDSARIEVGALPSPDEHGGRVFFVRDDGAGFDSRYARNLFGAFQRLHTPDQFEGTGIGLATVQRIVHRHGGAVWAEGEVEKGATFWFTLGPAEQS
jgi:PAS domain S-box-containing protein